MSLFMTINHHYDAYYIFQCNAQYKPQFPLLQLHDNALLYVVKMIKTASKHMKYAKSSLNHNAFRISKNK